MDPVPKVLLLVCDPGERAILQQTLTPHAELTWVCNPMEMTRQMERYNYDVLFCARTLCMGSWVEVLKEVRELNPNLPVIILSQTADEEEWEEVLAAGAFDLLAPPYYERELLPAVQHAAVSYEARFWHSHAGPPTARAS